MVRPGDNLGDRYEVIEKLASGGMGTLWRARHIELAVDVALKVIASNRADPDSLERFRREAQAAARLRSPNIVQVLDYGVFEEQPFFVMELLRGEDLATRLAREGKLAPARCLDVVDGIAKAMQLAHDQGVIHRDLKPANIFLEPVGSDEVVKVLDFGIAKDLTTSLVGATTSTGSLLGSPAYMSPEQVWNEGVGFPTDVWAMGVVSFEMLTGKNPFEDQTLAKVFERIVREPLPTLRASNPDVPLELDAFFERAFARDVSARISSAREFSRQFREAIETGADAAVNAPSHDGSATTPFAATRAGPQARDPKRVNRRRIAVAGVLATVALVGALMYARTATRPPTPTPAGRQVSEPSAPAEVAPPAPPPTAAAATARTSSVTSQPTAAAPASDAATALAPPPVAPAAPVRDKKSHAHKPARSKSDPVSSPPPAQVIDPRFGIPISR